MAKFIYLLTHGERVAVNVDAVVYVQPGLNSQTTLWFGAGAGKSNVNVDHALHEVVTALINGESPPTAVAAAGPDFTLSEDNTVLQEGS